MLYFDTSYLVRLHTRDPGWEKVRALAATDSLACGLHGQAEAVSAFHRKFREGAIDEKEFHELLVEFDRDCQAGAFYWLPISTAVMERLKKAFRSLPPSVHLRAADAMHLVCAAENALKEVYSNDEHLLAGASHFGLRGVNVL
jgi:predicted nucleic acid-binding protein